MKRLVIDIETVGTPWEEHDPYVREFLIKGMSDAEAEEEKRRGGLSPFRGRIVAIGVINADDGRGAVLYEVPGQEQLITRKDGNRTFISGTEKLILQQFWSYLNRDDRFVSFNGRQFDGPFIMIRSAINGVIPKRDLVGPRYAFHPNCDLRDALTFNGTVNTRQIRFNLDFACKAFGIASSKTDSMDGRAVETAYREGRYEEIASYCLDDVRATCELYQRLVPTILIWNEAFRKSENLNPPASKPAEPRTFMESVRAGSEGLAEALEAADDESASEAPVISSKPSMKVLKKLLRPEDDDELQPTDPFAEKDE
ncbi:MAG: ribonuclease H-like domain-containing protein [Thermoanaerobaculia bacterium]|nr:ribonuclease H-like domain-containing protein [Thermoanaerobaculia bacterium]